MIQVISMLTHNDQTVDGATQYYAANKEAKTPSWGFKDTNISLENAKALAASMKADGKHTFFESLVSEEADALVAAQTTLACKFDYMIGMEYFPKVHTLLKEAGVRYFPTCGRRAGYPVRMLYGTIQEIIDDAHHILEKGVDGISLSVFRYADGDPLELAKAFVKEVDAPLVLTGSINNDTRLDFVNEIQPWGFTIGSALFEGSEDWGKTMTEKLDYIFNYVNA